MISLDEQLLPEELDVLARTAGSALDVSAMFVVQDVFRAAAALRARLESGVLQAEGLSWSSFTMLFCLWVWGPQETRALAERMGVTRPTVSGVTDTLERRRLVERHTHADDARRRTVALTAAGRAHVRGALSPLQRRGVAGLRRPRSRGPRAARRAPAHARHNHPRRHVKWPLT